MSPRSPADGQTAILNPWGFYYGFTRFAPFAFAKRLAVNARIGPCPAVRCRGGHVMLDQEGPGCVYRIWMTSQQAAFPDQWIKVYFNGSPTPAIDMTIGQMFAGTNAPFLAPPGRGQPAV